MNRRILLKFITIFSASLAFKAHSEALSLESFLEQVREGNQSYQAHNKASKGAALRANESSFVTGPHLFGEVLYSEERQEPLIPSQPNDVRLTKMSMGLEERFSFGLSAKLSLTQEKYSLNGGNPLLLPVSESNFYRSRPQLELNFPLYKNLLGKETRAQRDALFNRGKAVQFGESFQAKMLLAEAESVYWKLALARALVKSTQENLERANKMRGWSMRRKKLGLADEASFLQADANFELRQLEYLSAVDEERATRRRLNSLRGRGTDLVNEELDAPMGAELVTLKIPEKFTEREDLKAQRAKLKAQKAATIIDSQKFKPSLDIFGLYAYNGKDADKKEAESEAFRGSRDSYAVGVKFSMPLDVFTIAKQQRGYSLEEKAAELQLDRKEFESLREWEDITQRFVEGRGRFNALLKIESAQRKKLLREKDLQGRGRSTVFQVLQYESEYANSQVARTRAQVELLSLYAVLKTYPESTSKE